MELAVLIGGRGVRLGGREKHLIRVEGLTILERIERALAPLVTRVFTVSRDEDRYPGKGAPGGVLTALELATSDRVLVVAGDMPWVSPSLVERMAKESADVVVCERNRQLEPLFALYATRLKDVWSLDGNPSLQSLIAASNPRVLNESEWRGSDPTGLAFESVNTPEQLAFAESWRSS
jgi:molybdenum cofactor guanylyltransferase